MENFLTGIACLSSRLNIIIDRPRVSENYVCRLKKQVDELKHAYILRMNLKYL